MSPIAAFSQLPAIFVAGSAFAVLYARSDNLMLCVGIHALANKPTLLVTDRFGLPDNLVFATVMCLIFGSVLGHKKSAQIGGAGSWSPANSDGDESRHYTNGYETSHIRLRC
jgi:hypothetical protein